MLTTFKGLITAVALSLSPMTAMALSPNNADACFKCNVARQWECYPSGASGAANCTPSGDRSIACHLSGTCIG